MKRIIPALAALTLLFSCTPEENNSGSTETSGDKDVPSVTIEANHISAVSAVLVGKANVDLATASSVIYGFQYFQQSESETPSVTTLIASNIDEKCNYSLNLTGLQPATTYSYWSFIRQKGQDTYGDTKTFTTKDVVSLLETKDASGVEATKATINAKLDLTDVPYKNLTYGFLWGWAETALYNSLECKEIKDNIITATLSNLSHKTQYWYKAYVTLDNQTFYSEVRSFATDVVKVESVSLDKTEYKLGVTGATITLKATVLPEDATDKSVEWSSDNDDVVSVDPNGIVTAKKYGKAKVTVTTKDQGKTATCEVTVTLAVPEAVDLGLSVKWASFNFGAVASEDYGAYYAWGETETKEKYSWSTYKFGTSDDGPFSKYSLYGTVDNKTVLEPEDDVAHVKLGGNWRIPTEAEWTELLENCSWTWTDNYNGTGVAGIIVTSNVEGYEDKSIFLPAAGGRYDARLSSAGSDGNYWSSSLSTVYPSMRYPSSGAQGVYFYYSVITRGSISRYCGLSVRPVSE